MLIFCWYIFLFVHPDLISRSTSFAAAFAALAEQINRRSSSIDVHGRAYTCCPDGTDEGTGGDDDDDVHDDRTRDLINLFNKIYLSFPFSLFLHRRPAQ